MRVKSIETNYNGIKYRSRTEARWAMLFDLAGIGFQYEPEGYELHSGRYVPDFWLDQWDCFFEVKPQNVIIEAGYYCDERSKAEDLAMATESDVVFGCGNPHVMLQLARVPVFGISPVHEWLTDKVKERHILQVTQYRFDPWKVYRPRGGPIDDWQPLGHPVNRVYHDFKKGWRDDDKS
jgi:hypothetical protein